MVRFGLLIAVFIVALDQASKWWLLELMGRDPRVIEVTPFFNLVLGLNRGVSFGLFDSAEMGPWPFLLLAAAITVALLVWLAKAGQRWTATALGLIIGGAVGNAIDRVRFGGVVDFLDFHALGRHWPAFNVADSAICIGVIMILIESLLARRR
ncbi:MAG: signal peptidase II [Alphaproteobacteria bacterium]|nr:signal peptidase II [Alphaproteobacteria bacterium]